MGIEISVHIVSPECKNVLMPDIENNTRTIRIKRKFSKDLSIKQCEAVRITLTEIFENYVFYSSILENIGEKALLEKIKKKMMDKLNTYQLQSLDMILKEFCIPVAFQKSPLTSETDASYLDYDNSLSVALIGGFGYGKTTLLKELLNFDSSYRFLLVDGGRTTLCQTYVRAFILGKNKKIYVPSSESEIDEDIEIPYDAYSYQNHIRLYSPQHAYDTIIVPALSKAFEVYQKSLVNGTKSPSKHIEILKSFCQDERYLLDSLFGKISENPHKNNGFYHDILDEFSKVTEPDMDMPDFTSNDQLRHSFYSTYSNALKDSLKILKELSETSPNLPADTISMAERENEIEVSFSVDNSAFSGAIDTYYKTFVDNTIKGGSLRVFVKQIYMETYIEGDNYDEYDGGLAALPALNDENKMKFHSILFIDTVGVGHVKKPQTSQNQIGGKINHDIIANQDILSGVDVILLLDKATESMREDVLSQIYSLESLGLIDRVILVYSFYNQFVKQDMDSDQHREEMLLDLLRNALRSLYPDVKSEQISPKAQRILNSFTFNNQAIVFLKGLVERKKNVQKSFSENANQSARRASRRIDNIIPVNAEDKKADDLNKGIENSTKCLGELMEKIIARQESFQKLCKERISIMSHYSEPAFQLIYTNDVYNRLSSGYQQYEWDIYEKNTPHHNTTGALCRNATYGKPIQQGISYRLSPVDDYLGIAQELISKYLDDTAEQAFEILRNDDGAAYDMALDVLQNQEYNLNNFPTFLGNETKTRVARKIKELLMALMVSGCQQEWIRMANDCGSGVKKRRAYDIYHLITGIALMENFQLKIMEITMDTIQEVVSEYSI